MDRSDRHRALALVITVAAAFGLAHVPVSPAPRGDPWIPPDAGRRSTDAGVDPNAADLDALERLPGVGPALARRIADGRDGGVYCSPEDLLRIRGIGARTLARFRARLAFDDPRCARDP